MFDIAPLSVEGLDFPKSVVIQGERGILYLFGGEASGGGGEVGGEAEEVNKATKNFTLGGEYCTSTAFFV